jgi:hypothetical protein
MDRKRSIPIIFSPLHPGKTYEKTGGGKAGAEEARGRDRNIVNTLR